jgi:asparagine synthase (glutamine-hydrolysing)
MRKFHTIFHSRGANWSNSENTHLCGKAILDNDEISLNDLTETLDENENMGDRLDVISGLNGFYAIARLDEDDALLAVDRVRSIPLFYGHNDNCIYISDDPHWIQEQVDIHDLDDLAKNEFLMTGYVTGDRTLSPAVKQVPAGEAVRLSLDGVGNICVERYPYQKYIPRYRTDISLDDALCELDKVLTSAFTRLINEADGRMIVVPLSGGYDSRLIVLMLKRLGYDNVITFSYGRKDNQESNFSKELAESLGFHWEFIEYTNDKWHDWYSSEEWYEYSLMAGNLSSTPHLQDWPAIKELKEKQLVPDNCLIVPGHTVALTASKNIQGDIDCVEQVVYDLIRDHYNISGFSEVQRICKGAEYDVNYSLGGLAQYPDRISAYESWDVNERQAKFIINSVRCYEYWGYSWWLPLLDKEFMDYWSNVPIEYRLDKKNI